MSAACVACGSRAARTCGRHASTCLAHVFDDPTFASWVLGRMRPPLLLYCPLSRLPYPCLRSGCSICIRRPICICTTRTPRIATRTLCHCPYLFVLFYDYPIRMCCLPRSLRLSSVSSTRTLSIERIGFSVLSSCFYRLFPSLMLWTGNVDKQHTMDASCCVRAIAHCYDAFTV